MVRVDVSFRRAFTFCLATGITGCQGLCPRHPREALRRTEKIARVRRIALDVLAWGKGVYWETAEIGQLMGVVQEEHPISLEHGRIGWSVPRRAAVTLEHDRRDFAFGPRRAIGRGGVTRVVVELYSGADVSRRTSPSREISVYVDRVTVRTMRSPRCALARYVDSLALRTIDDATRELSRSVESKSTCLSTTWLGR